MAWFLSLSHLGICLAGGAHTLSSSVFSVFQGRPAQEPSTQLCSQVPPYEALLAIRPKAY